MGELNVAQKIAVKLSVGEFSSIEVPLILAIVEATIKELAPPAADGAVVEAITTREEVATLKDDLSWLAWSGHKLGLDYMTKKMDRVFAILDAAAIQSRAAPSGGERST